MNLEKKYNFFSKNGYCIIDLFNKNEINLLIKTINKRLITLSRNNKSLKTKIVNNKIDKYHQFNLNDKEHHILMKSYSRYIRIEEKIKKKIYNKNILYILDKLWNHKHFRISTIFGAEKILKNNCASFRIARPYKYFKTDVAGLHVDGNYDGDIKDNYDNLVTIWIPLKGFSSKYTLKLAPRSHLYNHAKQLIKNNKTLQPNLKKNYISKFNFIRPDLHIGQGIIFHSNLLHGGSYNLGSNTRVSIDFRFINLNKFKI